LNCY